ncbi:MAG: hypothetical protein QGD90_05805 [Candidatus Hydrogenedentes bacterium]|nr:hypothetical protein [Candidatus Hydrogenedentota bacterium]
MSELSPLSGDTTRLLRHLVATIAYRSRLSIRDAPEGYETLRLAEGGMTAVELVNHMTNVLGYVRARITDAERVRQDLCDWEGEVERFYGMLGELDAAFASGVELPPDEDLKLLQGPLVDTCTHIGQLAALRRLAGKPVPGANFIKADIRIGHIGAE